MIRLCYLSIILFTLASCGNDLCKQTVTYTKATAIYGDVEELRQVEVNTGIQQIVDPGKIYIGNDFLLVGEENKGIHVIDNSNPYSPQQVNFIQIPRNGEFYVEGNTLYAESMYDVVSYDITDLENVTLRSRAEEVFTANITNSEGQRLIGFDMEEVTEELDCNSPINAGEINFFAWNNQLIPASQVPSSFAGNSAGDIGTINRIAYKDERLYIINERDLFTLEATDELSLLNVAENVGWDMETIYPYDDYLFVGTRSSMNIFNTENPDDPRMEGRFDHAQSCDPVLPTDNVAYVTLRSNNACFGFTNQLDVVDITNVTTPFLHKTIELSSPYGMSISGDVLYVGEGENGLSIFDISDKKTPVLLQTDTSVEAYDIIAHPTASDRILIANESGLAQYEIDEQLQSLILLSNFDL